MPRVHVGAAVPEMLDVFPGHDAHVFHQAGGIERLRQRPHLVDPEERELVVDLRSGGAVSRLAHQRRFRIDQFHKFRLAPEAPGFVEETPADDGWMIEIARNRSPHRLLETTPAGLGVTALPEIGKVRQQENANRVRVMEHQRIVDFDVDAQEIEAGAFRESDIVLDGLNIPGGVNPVGMIGLVERAANVDGLAIQGQSRRRSDLFGQLGRDAAQAEVAVHDIGFAAAAKSDA